jgi:endo-1,4-beta-xylanase
MVDKYSWLQTLTPRADGGPKRPLPYGDDYRPKPLRTAMAAALTAAPARR